MAFMTPCTCCGATIAIGGIDNSSGAFCSEVCDERFRAQQQQLLISNNRPVQQVIVINYPGNQQTAMQLFQEDAGRMAQSGYYPVSQTYAPGQYGCGAFLLALLLCCLWFIGILVFIYMALVKPNGTLSVTYELRKTEPVEEQHGDKICPMCAESVKSAAKVCRFCRHSFEGIIEERQTGLP